MAAIISPYQKVLLIFYLFMKRFQGKEDTGTRLYLCFVFTKILTQIRK